MKVLLHTAAAAAAVTLATASDTRLAQRAVTPTTVGSGVTVLFQNNLDWTDDANHTGFLLLDTPLTQASAKTACTSLGETLLSSKDITASQKDLLPQLRYAAYRGDFGPGQAFWLADGQSVRVSSGALVATKAGAAKLPTLCTQSARGATNAASVASANNSVSVLSPRTGNTYTGYRNLKSWRFLGVPYADAPKRFEYSKVASSKDAQVDATKFGPQCWQNGGEVYSEQCLSLNIFTPRVPVAGEVGRKLRPVMIVIHGGAFTSGTGADPTADGGNLASRGDVVVVTINYRLSTLGFLAVPNTTVTGNYGIADQVTALQWVQANIKEFGGDPGQVAIWGQSAGAGSVRALLASPKARGLFHAAMPASNLAGYNYATTYSDYYTPAEEYAVAGQAILNATGCLGSADAVGCLRAVPPKTLQGLSTVARYVIVDGIYITANGLNVTDLRAPGASARVPVLWGTTADDGAAFIGFPAASATSRDDAVWSVLYEHPDIAQAVISNTSLFPLPNTGNATLDAFNVSARIATDVELKCLDQATVYSGVRSGAFPKAWYYQFDRSYQIPGYSPNKPVCEAPITALHPNGDPSLPYFKCHSGDLYFEFGTLGQFSLPYRDALDLPFTQLVMDYWSAFIRTRDPNPDPAYLAARGYDATTKAIKEKGRWNEATKTKSSLRRMDYPSRQDGFVDVDECRVLGLPLDYYESH